MHPTVRTAVATVAGLFLAFGLIAAIEVVGHALYPPPGLNAPEPVPPPPSLDGVPLGALVFVLAAWTIATFAGGFVAAKIDGVRPRLLAGIVGVVVLAASVANLAVMAHPPWFSAAALIGIPVAAWLAGRAAAPMMEP